MQRLHALCMKGLLLLFVSLTTTMGVQAGAQTTFHIATGNPKALVALHKGDLITIQSNFVTMDPGETKEVEPLVFLTSSRMIRAVNTYGLSAFTFTAAVDGEILYAYIVGYDGDESATVTVTIGVKVIVKTDQSQYAITTEPAMPAIKAKATVTGIDPALTAGMQFTWEFKVHFDASLFPHGPRRMIDYTWDPATTVGPDFTPDFDDVIRGGDLTLMASITLNGQVYKSNPVMVQIVGTNPSAAEVKAYLPNYVLAQIAAHESSMRQFGSHGYPLWSGDNLGGVGLMQITYPAPTDDQVWDWTANADGSIAKFHSALLLAVSYPAKVQTYNSFQKLVATYNQLRVQQHLKPLTQVTVPQFIQGDFNHNIQQFEREVIRVYNGANGTDMLLGAPLQEYRLKTDAHGNIVVVINPGTLTGSVVWVQVLPKDRPQLPLGTSTYVDDVLKQHP